jgi:molybdopterin molybdotransferase
MMVFTAFVRPFLARLQGEQDATKVEVNTCKAVLTQKLPSVTGRADYVPVVLSKTNETLQATPLFGKSAMISLLARADGYVIVSEHVEGLDEGTEVMVHLFFNGYGQ